MQAHLLVEGCDIGSAIVQEQWSKGKEKVTELARQFGLLE